MLWASIMTVMSDVAIPTRSARLRCIPLLISRTLTLVLASACALPAVAAEAAAAGQWSVLNTYCEKCPNSVDWAGGVAFDTLQPGGIAQDAKTWEATVSKLRGRMMPPPGEKRPDPAAVNAFVSWMEGSLDRAAAEHPQAGYVSLHRLNRTEYARAVKDLLNVEVDPASLLPKDTRSDGFDNIANVLKVSPTFLDQYVSAARTVAALAVGNAHATKSITTYRGGRHNQSFHIDGMPLGTRGGFSVVHDFPADGTYTFNLNVGGLGGYGGGGQAHRAIFLIDGKQILERTVGGPEDLKKADQLQQEATKEFQARFRGIELPMQAGPHQLTVTFQQRAMSESDDWLESFNPASGTGGMPGANGLEISGPINVTGLADTPSRQRIFLCQPASSAEERPCATRILAALATNAYRRPVTDADLEAPLRFFDMGRKDKDFDAGIQNAIIAILSSPKFLYRAEEVAPSSPQKVAQESSPQRWRISDLDLASRLSFFLWSQGPDKQLIELASANRLHEPAQLQAQVKRLLADPRASTLASNFAYQWLQVDSMDKLIVDETVYPNFDEDLRNAFRKEMELWVSSILLQDRPVTDLLTANWTYLNERLALHYGIRDVRGSQFRRVALTDSHRFGLLGKGAVLMGTSYANRTAPVLRGAYVLEVISGTPPHAPPPAVPALKENVPGAKAETIRERMEAHRTTPSCNACHGIMDPIGLALENFDAMGRWQLKDADTGTPIESSGNMADGAPVQGPDDLRRILAGNAEQFVQTLTVNLMTYALGRSVEYFDMPEVRRIVREAAAHGNRFEDLVMGIINSPAFQYQQPPEDAEGTPNKSPGSPASNSTRNTDSATPASAG
jgi:hypothetical protein